MFIDVLTSDRSNSVRSCMSGLAFHSVKPHGPIDDI
jgi:hypothetical protein